MAPKVSNLKKNTKKISILFLNVDNQRWDNYIQKFNVNGIPQVNLFDKEGNLKSTFIGKQDETVIRESLANLEGGPKSSEEILNSSFQSKKKIKITGQRLKSWITSTNLEILIQPGNFV